MKKYCLISQIEQRISNEGCKDDHQIEAMKEELDQIVKNKTWESIPRPKDKNVIGIEWALRNKMNK